MYSVRNMTFALLICAVTIAPLAAAQKPAPVVQTNVTSIVHDKDALGTTLYTGSDDYNGTGQASYTSVLNVMSTISGAGWGLSLYNQTVRTIHLTFNHLSGGTAPLPPSAYYWENVEIYSICHDTYGNAVAFPGITSATPNCSFGLDFTDNKIKYKLVMSPNLPAAGPATGSATVTCTSGSAPCVSWTITPNSGANGSSYGVANLYEFGHNGSLVYIGQYSNTYRIDVTNP